VKNKLTPVIVFIVDKTACTFQSVSVHVLQDVGLVEFDANSLSEPPTTSVVSKLPKGFERRVTSAEQSSVLKAVARLASVCDELGIAYMLYGGTLLGSYRHHDMVPWDDDVDVLVSVADRRRLRDALADLEPHYGALEYSERIKFWSSAGSARQRPSIPWHWPYVDISFYEENATHIWDAGPEFRNHYIYPKSMVFPTHLRPFAGLWLPAPRDSLAFIVATYSHKRHCSSLFFSHRFEKNIPDSVSMRCQKLRNVYPFVHRRPAAFVAVPSGSSQRVALSPGIVEVLMLGDLVLHTVLVEEPTYSTGADPYVLPTRRRLRLLSDTS